MRKFAVVALLSVGLAAGVAVSPAEAAPRKFKNCTALNKVYRHGVAASKSARDKAARPVKGYRVDAKLYAVNRGLDRDKDKIACEKK